MFIRLTTLLCAGLYGGMVLFGTDTAGSATAEAAAPANFEPVSARSAYSPSTSPLAISAAFTAVPNFDAEPKVVAENVQPVSGSATTEVVFTKPADDGLLHIGNLVVPDVSPKAEGENMVEVIGNVVNLRAGPSTSNDVVGQLRRGARAERIATAGAGWVQIRDLDTGVEGYMSDDFLAPVTQANT